MLRRGVPAVSLPAAVRMIFGLALVGGLLASLVALTAPAAAQGLDCQTLSVDTAQSLLLADPSFAVVLDPDGDGLACNHGGTVALSDPLAARFGGSRDSFEAAYGEPAGDRPAPYPLGWEYAIDGIGTAHAFYEKDQLVYLTLEPERRRLWTPDEAGEVLTAFLPLDIMQVGEGEQATGFVILYGYSAAVAEYISPGVYAEYGLSGESGDLYTIFRLTDDGYVSAVEIALGNEMQNLAEAGDGQGGAGTAGTSDAEEEYLAALEGQVQYLADSVERFNVLLNDPNLGDQASIDELEEILTTWTAAPLVAFTLTPPPGYEEVHAAYLSFTEYLARAAQAIFDGDDAAVVANLEQAQEQLVIVRDLLEEATGWDLLDVKSG